MSKPIAVPARPGLSHTPALASADDAAPSQPVSPCPARSGESWSQSRSQGPACAISRFPAPGGQPRDAQLTRSERLDFSAPARRGRAPTAFSSWRRGREAGRAPHRAASSSASAGRSRASARRRRHSAAPAHPASFLSDRGWPGRPGVHRRTILCLLGLASLRVR